MSNKAELWKLHTTAKATASRPSDLLCIDDRWTALQLDNAVSLAGNVLENASQELDESKDAAGKVTIRPRYTMKQLLDPDFRLPNPNGETADPVKLGRLGGIDYDEVG